MNIFTSIMSLIRTISISDILDISIVAFLIYHLVKIIRESRAGQLVKGIIIMLCGYFIAGWMNLRMLSTLLSNFFQFSVFGLLIVFQPELRRVLEQIGRSRIPGRWSIGNISSDEEFYIKECKNLVKIVSDAVFSLSEEKMGALIVFERKTKLGEVINTGTLIKSVPSVPMICNIFYTKAPLHDGALIIKDGLIYAGGCILPLTKNSNVSRKLGTRHRAAMGMSENSDAAVVVVSEETGRISIILNGILKSYSDMEMFRVELEEILADRPESVKRPRLWDTLNRRKNNG